MDLRVKKTGNLKLFLHILFALTSFWTFAQKTYIDVAISASTVTDIDPFTYTITTNCDCDIIAPDLTDFEVLQKQPGEFHSSSNNNGVRSEKCIRTLSFVLRAKKKGEFKIQEAIVKCKNKINRQSEQISVEVLSAQDVFNANEGVANFYYKIESNKKSVYAGEPFIVNFYLYSIKRPQDITTITSGNAGGIWRQNLFNESASTFAFPLGTQKVKGNEYYVVHLRKEVCIANATGKLIIEPYFGRAVDQYDYMGSSYFEGYSNNLEITVKETPGEKPENFSGMVGDFELTHEISKTEVSANRAIELKVKISGSGNFHNFRDPEFLFPESFLVSEPEYSENFELTEKGIEGSVTYNYVITPTAEGQYSILPYSFAYYSLTEKRIKSVSTTNFTINVTKGNDVAVTSSHNSTVIVEDDIRFIHTKDNGLFSLGDIKFGSLFYIIALFFPLTIAFFFIIIKRKKSKMTDEEHEAVQQKSVKKSAIKDIQQIKKMVSSVDSSECIKQLKATLDDYLMTHLKVGRSALSKQNITELLNDKNIDPSVQKHFGKIWDELEMARYAPIAIDNVSSLIDATADFFKATNSEL